MLELSGWSVTKVSATAKKGEGLHQLRVTCVNAIYRQQRPMHPNARGGPNSGPSISCRRLGPTSRLGRPHEWIPQIQPN